MKQSDPKLADLHEQLVAKRSPAEQAQHEKADRDTSKHIRQLARRGILSVSQLINSLPTLPQRLKDAAMWFLYEHSSRASKSRLLAMLHKNPSVLLDCAFILGMMRSRGIERMFVRIAKDQLAAAALDRQRLEAAIDGLKSADDSEAIEVLATIFERTDLPGWLRDKAGDALGCGLYELDRRTRLFRRIWTAALQGLDEPSIHVQFGSMWVIAQLACCYSPYRNRSNSCFKPALPRLREIAAKDKRLIPGYWWPMCEEAKDVIKVIKTGSWFENDASERCLGNTERGPMIRD
jgi:hypothetical protein